MWDSKLLLLREKFQDLSTFPIIGPCIGGGVYDQIVSQPLLSASVWVWGFRFVCLFFSHLPYRVTHLVFSVFYEENVSKYSCRFSVSVGGVCLFRIFLEPEPKKFSFDFI